jgi:hypothetical protein
LGQELQLHEDGFVDDGDVVHRNSFMPACTPHRSRTGQKLYAKRAKNGCCKDLQSCERAHVQGIEHNSKQELARRS